LNVRRSVTMLAVIVIVLVAIYLPIIIGGFAPRLGLDLQGGLSVTLQSVTPASSDQINKAADIVRRRVNALGLTEPVVAPQGNSRILVQIAGESDPNRVLSIIGSTAQLQFREVTQVINPGDPTYDETPLTPINPSDNEAYQALKDQAVTLPYTSDKGDDIKVVMGPTRLTGDIISDAQAAVDSQKAGYKISFTLTSEASPQFGALTTELKGKQLAIVLDYKVESFPNVNEAITSGQGEISGSFTRGQARDLALVLRMGALPIEFKADPLVENVSATLGRDSLRRGLLAGIIGLILVLLYMLLMYRGLGLITCMSLAVFGLLMYGIVTLLGHYISWSLTLAGIAGIVVSIGISADSSVVFFERLKEEVREGKTLRSSVDRGFKSAWRTMVTADATTFITAFILWILSIGPVKGFAFTLGIATILDLITMYFFTHSTASLFSRFKVYNTPRFVGVGKEIHGSEA